MDKDQEEKREMSPEQMLKQAMVLNAMFGGEKKELPATGLDNI